MSHPAYTVVYFPIRGRAEPIRLLLASLGLPFDDVGMTRDGWPGAKPTMPLNQLPVLIERSADGDERRVPQSQAILRHLGRVHGAYGGTEDETLAIDVLAETVHDVRAALAPFVGPATRGKDPDGMRALFADKLPVLLGRLDKAAAAAPVGGKPSWAHCLAFDLLDSLQVISPDVLAPFPALTALHTDVATHPNVAAYLPGRHTSELAALRRVLETGEPL